MNSPKLLDPDLESMDTDPKNCFKHYISPFFEWVIFAFQDPDFLRYMQTTHLGILGALLLESVLQHLDTADQVGFQVLLPLPLTLGTAK